MHARIHRYVYFFFRTPVVLSFSDVCWCMPAFTIARKSCTRCMCMCVCMPVDVLSFSHVRWCITFTIARKSCTMWICVCVYVHTWKSSSVKLEVMHTYTEACIHHISAYTIENPATYTYMQIWKSRSLSPTQHTRMHRSMYTSYKRIRTSHKCIHTWKSRQIYVHDHFKIEVFITHWTHTHTQKHVYMRIFSHKCIQTWKSSSLSPSRSFLKTSSVMRCMASLPYLMYTSTHVCSYVYIYIRMYMHHSWNLA